ARRLRPASVALAVLTTAALVHAGDDLVLVHPPAAANSNPPPFSNVAPNILPANFSLHEIANGFDALENPSGTITNFGFLNDNSAQATKPRPEADENPYRRFDHTPGGPDASFASGRHFLYQGHENGGGKAYLTRINLDVDRRDPHRITLLTPVDASGNTGFSSIDGSTWNPFTERLLFAEERGGSSSLDASGHVVSTASNGRVFEVTPDWPPAIRTLECVLGKGGWEGI